MSMNLLFCPLQLTPLLQKHFFSLKTVVSQCTQYEVCYALPFNLNTMMVRASSTPCRRRASMVCLLSAMMRLIPHTPLLLFCSSRLFLHTATPPFFLFFCDIGWNITATRLSFIRALVLRAFCCGLGEDMLLHSDTERRACFFTFPRSLRFNSKRFLPPLLFFSFFFFFGLSSFAHCRPF